MKACGMRVRYCLAAFILLSELASYGQLPQDNFEIRSDVWGTTRQVKVWMPESYLEDDTTSFAVLWVLDAQSETYWQMVCGNLAYLQSKDQIIPCIAVGIVSPDRSYEYSPLHRELADHLQIELMPYIRDHYRTTPLDIVMGHSWAGAFVANTLFSDDSDLFEAYLAISPSLSAIDGRILNQADSVLVAEMKTPKVFYCATGDLGIEEAESIEDMAAMSEICLKYSNPALAWLPSRIEKTDHFSCVAPAMVDGLLSICSRYMASERMVNNWVVETGGEILPLLEIYGKYNGHSFGYWYSPPVSYWGKLADSYLQLEEFITARDLYLFGLQNGDENVVNAFNLALTYEALEDRGNARKYFLRADELLEQQKDQIKESLYRSLKKAVGEKLGE